MSSTPSAAAPDDRTARARIRDAALVLFGERGFSAATVRDIAERAGVSPGLVVHHFGSKDGLRAAVDDHLLALAREGTLAALTGSVTWTREDYEAVLAQHAPTLTYLARALSEDSEVGRRLYDGFHADTVAAMQAGVEAGVLHPTDDEPARAAAMLNADLGNLLLVPHLRRVLGVDTDAEAMVRLSGPLLDVYTDGLFVDDRFRAPFRQSDHVARTVDPDPPPTSSVRVGDAEVPSTQTRRGRPDDDEHQ